MDQISAVIITKNEERNIKRCLKSLVHIVDEVIIIDANSSDNTEHVVKEFPNVVFIRHDWEGYSRSKNFGNSCAKYDWILSIDADEELSPELQRAIAEEKQMLNGLYRFARLTNYCGKWIHHSSWYPDFKVRLFNRNKAQWIGDSIHETLHFDKNSVVNTLKGDCYHYTAYSIDEHLLKINQYTSTWAKEAYLKGKHANMFQLIFKPFTNFVNIYFFKKGFLDGYYGFVISVLGGISRFLRISKLYNMDRNGNS